jgi:hypothetical protein
MILLLLGRAVDLEAMATAAGGMVEVVLDIERVRWIAVSYGDGVWGDGAVDGLREAPFFFIRLRELSKGW